MRRGVGEQANHQPPSMVPASVPTFRLPLKSSCDGPSLGLVSQVNPFLPKLLWVMVLITAIGKQSRPETEEIWTRRGKAGQGWVAMSSNSREQRLRGPTDNIQMSPQTVSITVCLQVKNHVLLHFCVTPIPLCPAQTTDVGTRAQGDQRRRRMEFYQFCHRNCTLSTSTSTHTFLYTGTADSPVTCLALVIEYHL